jgi:hypothetical protein
MVGTIVGNDRSPAVLSSSAHRGNRQIGALKHRRSAKPWIFLATAANETIALKSSRNKTGGDDYG